MGRAALIVAHTSRDLITRKAAFAVHELIRAGFEVRMLEQEARECCITDVVTVAEDPSAAENAELVLVFGGDGTFLRAAEFARPARVPMLGVNFGRVGFLAGAEPDALAEALTAVVDRRYDVEERMTLGRPSGALRSDARDGVGAQRGVGREERARADAGAGGRGQRSTPCCVSAATACCAPRRPDRRPTRIRPVVPSSGRVWMRSSWYPTRRMRCSRGPWW